MYSVLLISPHRWKPSCSPHGLEHLAHHLHGAGFTPVIIDSNTTARPFEKIIEHINENKTLLIGISVRNLDTAFLSPRPVFFPQGIRRLIKRIKARTKIPIVLGGVAYSSAPGPLLEYLGADYGLQGGDGEDLVALTGALRDGELNPESIPGLVYRSAQGIRINRPGTGSLILPAISRSFVSQEKTYRPGLNNHYSWGSVETKRGCHHSCLYCLEPESKTRILRIKPPEAVIAEVEELAALGIRWIWFTDSEFNLDINAAKELCTALIKKFGNSISWGAYFHPTPFDVEFAGLLVASGCRAMGMDAGHGDEAMIKNLGKNFSWSDLEKTSALLSKTAIAVKYSALLGGPGETKKTINTGLKKLAGLRGIVEPGVGFRVYPGTPFAGLVKTMDAGEQSRSLFGKVRNNPHFLEPIFYFSPFIARNYAAIIEEATAKTGTFLIPGLYQVDTIETGDWRGIRPGYSRLRSNELLMLEEGQNSGESPGASYRVPGVET